MKRLFTLALVMAMAITTFAQVKSVKRPSMKDMKTAQAVQFTGMEERDGIFPASNRSIMESPEEIDMSLSAYDWQSNMGARNFTAVWPDGFAVMCFTQATDASYSDRGTGLLIWDPEVGEWEYTETRVEGVKTGFGSIARYKENGLVIAAHTSSDCRIFMVEDFREGNRDFGQGIVMPTDGEDGRTQDPCWPVVQCSGDNLDIIHIITTEYSLTTPMPSALLYTRYEGGEFTVHNHIIPNLDANNMSDGGSNICYFMPYDPAKPNRVSFILNIAWSDGKAVISEDNGATWTERVFYQHPGINETYDSWFFYPRWTAAAYDNNDRLHVVYEWNGTTGEPGSGSYYPGVGGVGYWSQNLFKNEMCIGGIGEVGGHFIMDTAYLFEDFYASEWYWSDANHDPLPECFGMLQVVDDEGNVLPYDDDSQWPEDYHWIGVGEDAALSDHGSYNCGICGFASMHMDGDKIYAFWSMLAGGNMGEGDQFYNDGTNHFFRLFGAVSVDGGYTWTRPVHLLTDFMNLADEMVYGQVIPFVYTDEEGEYVWYCYANDQEAGTFVQEDDPVWDNNFYHAFKVHFDYIWDGVEEPTLTVAPTINVYPNPANGSFNVLLNNESNVNIYNAVGQLVKTYNNVTELNVNLEAGVYFVNANNQTVKVVVR